MPRGKQRRLDEVTERLYRELTDPNGHVNRGTVRERVLEELRNDPDLAELEAVAEESVERVDKSFTYAANTAANGATASGVQLPLYDPDGYFALGEGDRVKQSLARRPEILAWWAIQTNSHLEATEAYTRKGKAVQVWLAHLPDDTTPLGSI